MNHPGQPVDRAIAISAIAINQLATPGLGSILARRFLSGAGQLCLALLGAVLILAWFLKLYAAISSIASDESVVIHINYSLGILGFAIFAASWLWAGVTSLTIWRAAQPANPPPLLAIPPRL